MDKIIIAVICAFFFVVTSVKAENTDLVFNAIKLNELAKLGFNQIANIDYIADHAFNVDETTVTLYQKDRTPDQVKDTIRQLIEINGYNVIQTGNGLLITKKQPSSAEQKQPFFYKAKHRSTNYLTEILRPVFRDDAFLPKQDGVDLGENDLTNHDVVANKDSGFGRANKDYDVFIFHGTPTEIGLLQTLLADLDTPPQEILVRAYIYEVIQTNGSSSAFTAALSLLNGKLTLGLAAATLANQIGFKTDSVSAVFSAFGSDSRFRTISSPTLRVKDRNKAVFTVGAEVPVLSGVSITGNGVTTQSIDYINSGVILQIEPTIRGNNIQLKIDQQLSDFAQTTTGVNTSPTLLKREISTVIDAQDDEIILLGGLEQQTDNKTRSGVPFLPDLFKSRSSENNKSDILLVLHVTRI